MYSDQPVFDQEALENFFNSGNFVIPKPDRKGGLKNIDLKDIILKIELVTNNRIAMQIVEAPGKTVRPLDITKHIFKLPDTILKKLLVVKTPWFKKNV